MTKYYVAKEFGKYEKLLHDIFEGENYQLFDPSSAEEVTSIINAGFDLIILSKDNTVLERFKSKNINGLIALIFPKSEEGFVEISDNIYMFKNLNTLKQSSIIKNYLSKEKNKSNVQEKEKNDTPEAKTQSSVSEDQIIKSKSTDTQVHKKEKSIQAQSIKQVQKADNSTFHEKMNEKEKNETKSFYQKINKLENIAIENSYFFNNTFENSVADERNRSNPVNLENDYPPHIDKKISARYKLTNQALNSINNKRRKIAIWKPYENRTALHIIMNFAIFLAESGLDVAVVETLSREGELLDQLLHYTDMPPGWYNFMETVFNPHKNYDKDKIVWRWKNVDWFPLTPSMNTNGVEWYPNDLDFYMNVLDNYDISFIYIPQTTGIPIRPSDIEILFTMKYINELWIIADSFFKVTDRNKEYIHELQNSYFNIDRSFLIYTNCFDKKRALNTGKALDLPLLAVFPFFEHEIHLNNVRGSKPIMTNENISKILLSEFQKMREHYPEYKWLWEKVEIANNLISSGNWNKNKLGEKFLRLKSFLR